MPIINGVKCSKSELILRLLRKETRENTLTAVFSSTGVRLPKCVLFGENYDVENCKNIILDNNYTGFYSYFSLKRKVKAVNLQNFEVLIDSLMGETNTRLFKLLEISSTDVSVMSIYTSTVPGTHEHKFTGIPGDLSFVEDSKTIFYLSLLIMQSTPGAQKLKLEQQLIFTLKKVFKESNTKETKKLLKLCKIKFQKETIKGLVQSFVCEMKLCSDFLSWISCKLPENFLDLWFEDSFDLSDAIINKLNKVSLSGSLPFKENVVKSLLSHQNFRKYVFNNEINQEFLNGMAMFANRPDYNFYYASTFNRQLCPRDTKMPKDECEYEFFDNFRNRERLSSNLIKIRNYLRKHSYTKIFSLFVAKNIKTFTEYASLADLEDIFVRIIQHNSNLEDMGCPSSINRVIFNDLKSNEKFFRKIVKYFKNPTDPILYNILTGSSEVKIKDAISYIKIAYDSELLAYFASQDVVECVEVMDSWNYDFFLEVFASLDHFTVSESLAILGHLNSNSHLFRNKKTIKFVSKIIGKINELKSAEIFTNLPSDLKNFYLLKHVEFIPAYVKSMNLEEISMEDAAVIYELKSQNPNIFEETECQPSSNRYLLYATANSFPLDHPELADLLFEWIFIRKSEASFIFAGFFKQLLEEISGKFTKDEFIGLTSSSSVVKYNYDFFIGSLEDKNISDFLELPEISSFSTQLEKIYFILKIGLSNKYSVFVLFDQILEILASGNSFSKILILYFVDPSLLCKSHILKFINAVVPLLSSSNYMICRLSRDSLNMVHLEAKEIQNILPEIIQAFSSPKPITRSGNNELPSSYKVFLESLKSTVFNNYLCFNSLNLILQLLFKHLSEYTKDSLFILSKISAIIKDKDLRYVSGLIFSNLSKFVVNNNFCSGEALEISTEFSLYVNFEDFEILLKNLKSMRICTYLVGILKFKEDHELNKRIINHVVSASPQGNVEPTFIAAASELDEFNQYLEQFLPTIKSIFKDNKPEIRNIAVKAFKFILKRAHGNIKRASSINQDVLVDKSIGSQNGDAINGVGDNAFSKRRNYGMIDEIDEFLVHSIIYDDFPFRIAALEIIGDYEDNLPIIYILRNDHHSLVKKEAQDLWKIKVPNTNTLLRTIYKDVLEYVKYRDCKAFSYALHGAVSEMATKYCGFLEKYILDELTTISSPSIDEFILLEAIKTGKMIGMAIEFLKTHFVMSIFKEVYKTAAISKSSEEKNHMSPGNLKMGTSNDDNLYHTMGFNSKYIKTGPAESIACEKFLKYFTTDQLIEVCIADQDICYEVYICFSNTPESIIFIDFLSISQKIEILKLSSGNSAPKISEDTIYLLKTIEPCEEIESALLRLWPIFSYYYLLNPKIIDHRSLGRIFERVFDACSDLEVLITLKNSVYLKNCSFYNIHSDSYLVLFLYLVSRSDDKKSFEKIVSLMNYIIEKDISLVSYSTSDLSLLPNDFIFGILGYLLRNYISLNRRGGCHGIILELYSKYSRDIGFFRNIIEESILNK